MITVIIPTLNSQATLAATLECLIPAAVQGLVREVLIADGGSKDATLKIADGFGATTICAGIARTDQLNAGAAQARFPWLLFVNPDCVLDAGWEREADQLLARIDAQLCDPTAAVFRFALDDYGLAPRTTEFLARWSATLFGFGHSQQGLLIPRALYTEAGGFKSLPLLESVDLTRRVGRKHLMTFRSAVVENATQMRQHGYMKSLVRYYGCLLLYAFNVPANRFAKHQLAPASQATSI